MAPQAATPTTQHSLVPSTGDRKPFIPIALLIFLGLCLAYTLSYVLYRIVMARRRRSEEEVPEAPDRGISQFMNGARLTLNLGSHKSTPLTLAESLNILDEEKPLTDSQRGARSEVPTSSPAGSSSTPFIILTPSFSLHPSQELSDIRLPEEPGSTRPQESSPPPAPPTQQPFAQRVAAKVKFLSRDRAEAITLDPKLAPVQGPLRPLSMVPCPSPKRRTILFGLGFKHMLGHDGELETVPQIP